MDCIVSSSMTLICQTLSVQSYPAYMFPPGAKPRAGTYVRVRHNNPMKNHAKSIENNMANTLEIHGYSME